MSAGYRILSLSSGRKIAVWYPSRSPESRLSYSKDNNGFYGSAASGGEPSECGAFPLVLFSHGLGGCGIQSVFLTEELARHGYVVAAPDHRDAYCATDGRTGRIGNVRTDASFLKPELWSDESNVDRRRDLQETIDAVSRDAKLEAIADTTRIGAVGHSLGGYTVIGLAGAWPSWKDDRIKAVLALSPYALPFAHRGSLGALGVAVMLQGAELDWGITPSLEGDRGVYASLHAPKYFVKLKGGTHFEWTNLTCFGEASTLGCLQRRPNAYLITRIRNRIPRPPPETDAFDPARHQGQGSCHLSPQPAVTAA